MRQLQKVTSIAIICALVALNVYIFVLSMSVSSQIESYEAKIARLKLANTDLENKAYEKGSLEYTASSAAILGFAPAAQTMVIHTSGVALRTP